MADSLIFPALRKHLLNFGLFHQGFPRVTSYGIGGRQYAVNKLVDGVTFGSFMLGKRNIDIGPVDLGGKISGLLPLIVFLKLLVIPVRSLCFLSQPGHLTTLV